MGYNPNITGSPGQSQQGNRGYGAAIFFLSSCATRTKKIITTLLTLVAQVCYNYSQLNIFCALCAVYVDHIVVDWAAHFLFFNPNSGINQ